MSKLLHEKSESYFQEFFSCSMLEDNEKRKRDVYLDINGNVCFFDLSLSSSFMYTDSA